MFTISKGFAVISATKNLRLPFIEYIFASGRTRFLEWVVSENQEKMENKKVAATEDENEVDDWDIYKEVISGPSHGRGLGGGYSTKDVYPSDDQGCNKRICLEREEEHEKLKEEVKGLKSVMYELKDLVQSMRENNSNTYARSRQFASMDNVKSCLDAHLEDE
ncbi:hypothetical protein ACE6H2_015470 [Prunus campanulata]